MRVYKNCVSAYEDLRFFLLRTGGRYENKSVRSEEKVGDVVEVIGVSFRIFDKSDVFDLIERIDDNSDERIERLIQLGTTFIEDERLPMGKNHYTYNDRIFPQKEQIIKNIIKHKEEPNRQAFLGIWDPYLDSCVLGEEEVPCSIGYHFIPRGGVLEMVYFMRSLDLYVFPNDIYLSGVVLGHVAERCEMRVGTTIFFVGCLHSFDL